MRNSSELIKPKEEASLSETWACNWHLKWGWGTFVGWSSSPVGPDAMLR